MSKPMPATSRPCPLQGWLETRTAQELARKAGVNKGSLSEFLRRVQRLSLENLHAIAKASGVPFRALLLWQEGEGDTPPAKPAPRRKAAKSSPRRAGRAA